MPIDIETTQSPTSEAPPRIATPTNSTLLICTYSRFLATTGLP